MTRANIEVERIDLDELMRRIGARWNGDPNIRFLRRIRPQYRVRRQSKHDGALWASIELLKHAILPLVRRESYAKVEGFTPNDAIMRSANYLIGTIYVIRWYGRVTVPAGTIDGVRERVVIPVRVAFNGEWP